MLRTRGKRVVAECTLPNELVQKHMRSTTEVMFRARQVSNLGGFMSGVNNNGAHSANGITAMFIATGQDVANVAESSAAFVFAELFENGDYYYSVTIPSDRKSTRLNSSHANISYAVFCLKKNTSSRTQRYHTRRPSTQASA